MRPQCPSVSVQWHITTECENRCRHCYMYDERTYRAERDNILSTDGLIRILDGFDAFQDKWGVDVSNFAISGGDPLLRHDWRVLLAEMKKRGKHVRLMGNPETITERNAADMAALGVLVFQMSLDGLESTHDRFRAQGSFERTIKAMERLKEYGIQRSIMFTLYPENAHEMIPLMRFVAEHSCAGTFSFDVGCHVGNAVRLEQNFTASELRKHFAGYLHEKRRLRDEGNPITIHEKPGLLRVSRFEEGTFYPLSLKSTPVISGCLAGWNSVAVLSDGAVLACRRLPIPSGKMPEKSFEEIFLGSELMRKFRRAETFEGCGSCDFYQVCRGCPASVHGITGNPFASNPFCFRPDVAKHTTRTGGKEASPPLHVGLQEEFDFFSSRFVMVERETVRQFLDEPDLRRVFVSLMRDPHAKETFLSDPGAFLEAYGCRPDEERVFFLVSHFVLNPLAPTMEARQQMILAKQKFEALVLARYQESGQGIVDPDATGGE